MALNHIELQGNLGRDPELTEQESPKGRYKRVTFSLAVSRDYGDGTDWFFCVMYGKRAEVVEKWFRKGSEILISGRMESYKPKKDPDHDAWLVKVEDFHFTRNGTDQKPEQPNQQPPGDYPETMEEVDDDVPF